MTNILEAYKKQKKVPKKKQNKRLTCHNCIHSSAYDSELEYKVIGGRCYCRKQLTVVQIGCARSCPYFECYS